MDEPPPEAVKAGVRSLVLRLFKRLFGEGFDWDDGNIEKCQKHGVLLEEIEALFLDKSLRVSPDIKHSKSEDRFIATGVSLKGKHIFVGFTFREKQEKRLIRPISTR